MAREGTRVILRSGGFTLRNRALLIVAASAALLAVPVIAGAEPTHKGKVGAGALVFEWEGGPLTGANDAGGAECGTPSCESTLIQVEASAGSTAKLKVDVSDFGQFDLELYAYSSDATGKPIKLLGSSEGAPGTPETVSIKANPGFYLIQVASYLAAGALYKGKATLSGVGAAAPTAPPAVPPAVQPSPPTNGDQLPPSGTLTASIAVLPSKPAGAAVGGVPLKVDCSVVCKGALKVEISAAQAKKLKLGKKKLVIGKGAFTVDKRNQPINIKLTGKAAKKIRKAKSVKLTVLGAITDAQGGQSKAVKAAGTLKK